jgi:hypothetical protein
MLGIPTVHKSSIEAISLLYAHRLAICRRETHIYFTIYADKFYGLHVMNKEVFCIFQYLKHKLFSSLTYSLQHYFLYFPPSIFYRVIIQLASTKDEEYF